MNKLTILIIAAVAALYVLFSSIFVVNEREQAIVTRFGEITRVYSEPGLYFKIPTDIVEAVQIIEDRLLRYDLDDILLQVSDGKFYVVDAFVTFKIDNPTRFRQSVSGNLQTAERRIATRFDAALRQVYGKRDFNAALSAERTAMMLETRNILRADMAELGIDIIDVRVLRTDLTSQVSSQTFDRMKAERLAQAALARARGQELARALTAVADRQAIEFIATANKEAEITRGEGDAERNRIFAEAYNRDVEFFEFYRSLQAYRESVGGEDTSLVLSPDSEFFRYFGDSAMGTLPVLRTPEGETPDQEPAAEPAPVQDEAVDPEASEDTSAAGAEPASTAEPAPAAASDQ